MLAYLPTAITKYVQSYHFLIQSGTDDLVLSRILCSLLSWEDIVEHSSEFGMVHLADQPTNTTDATD